MEDLTEKLRRVKITIEDDKKKKRKTTKKKRVPPSCDIGNCISKDNRTKTPRQLFLDLATFENNDQEELQDKYEEILEKIYTIYIQEDDEENAAAALELLELEYDEGMDIIRPYLKNRLELNDFINKFYDEIEDLGIENPVNIPLRPSIADNTAILLERERKFREGRELTKPTVRFTQEFRNQKVENCKQLYKTAPWLTKKIKNIFVLPMNENFSDIFYIKSITFNYEGQLFYKAKDNVFEIQCLNLEKKVLNFDTIQIISDKGVNFLFKQVYLTIDNIPILYNEDIITLERNYINDWLKNSNAVNNILESTTIDPSIIATAKLQLTSHLSNANPTLYNEKSIELVIRKIADLSTNALNFINRLNDLIIFIDLPINLGYETIFYKRLKEGIYEPEFLPLLTEKEKLPEIFYDKRTPLTTVKHIGSILEEEKKLLTSDFIKSIGTEDTTGFVRIQTKPKKSILKQQPTITLPKWKDLCFNNFDVENLRDEELTFYSEKDKVYCFSINELLIKFKNNNFLNQYTNRMFSQKFIKRFMAMFKEPIPVIEKEQSQEYNPLINFNENTQKLIDILESQLDFYENNRCNNCQTRVGNEGYVETIKNGNRIGFCSVKCLEDYKF